MSKPLFFVRNKHKLINTLCIAIFVFITLYSLLTTIALSGSFQAIFLSQKYASIFITPILQLLFLLIFLFRYKKSNLLATDNNSNTQERCLKDLLVGTNLMVSLIMMFIQIDVLNNIKNIQGFGKLPIYICAIAGIIFLFLRIRKAINEK